MAGATFDEQIKKRQQLSKPFVVDTEYRQTMEYHYIRFPVADIERASVQFRAHSLHLSRLKEQSRNGSSFSPDLAEEVTKWLRSLAVTGGLDCAKQGDAFNFDECECPQSFSSDVGLVCSRLNSFPHGVHCIIDLIIFALG